MPVLLTLMGMVWPNPVIYNKVQYNWETNICKFFSILNIHFTTLGLQFCDMHIDSQFISIATKESKVLGYFFLKIKIKECNHCYDACVKVKRRMAKDGMKLMGKLQIQVQINHINL